MVVIGIFVADSINQLAANEGRDGTGIASHGYRRDAALVMFDEAGEEIE